MRRMLALVALLAMAATACGGDGAIDAGPVPGRPDTTVTTETPATAPATTAAVICISRAVTPKRSRGLPAGTVITSRSA